MARRPLGRGYVEEFEVRKSVIPLSEEDTFDINRKLRGLLPVQESARKGDDLANILGNLGESYIEDGRVKWDPPPNLDPGLVDYFSRSVEALNNRLEVGELEIDENGDIRPIRNF